jgi:serine/threonine-protein kinase
MDDTTVTQIGKYDILGQIGEGGMGIVYRGEDKGIGRPVAIKTLKNATSELRQRFLVEARTGALNHPNIVTVFEVGEQDGNPYIAMEYLEGGSLDTQLRSDRSVPLVEKLDIIRQVCLGLGYAHQEGVIHRDIKPANVMVNAKGQVKIVDFGIARLENTSGHTATGQVIGTVDYISPERIKGNRSDGRADIWSTGVMLYQLLTNNHLPFPGDDPTTKIYKIVNEPFEPLSNFMTDYPSGIDHILGRALAKDPNDRYESAEEMAGDIEEINEALKRARMGEMIIHVKRLIGQQQLTTAKQDLLGLQRLDPQNTEIKKLFRDVSEQLARQQKSDQVRQLASQAEEAVLSQRYAEAIEFYRQAAKVEPSEHGFTEKIEHIRALKEKADKVASLLQQARDARHHHDFERASELIAQALPLDERNTDLRNEQARIYQEAERAKKEEARLRLTRAGREQFAARQYTQAIQALGDALKIDPTDAENQRLYQEAVALQEEQRRRTVVEKIVAEIEDCIYRSEIDRALALIQRALEKLPGETALLRLKAETEEKQREFAAQRLVEQTSMQVQSLFVTNPQEALACVQRARETMPGEPRLIALEEQVVQRLKRDNLAGLKAQYLKQAQASIDARQYDQAIQILETAAIDCGEAPDIAYLLGYARTEKSKDARKQVVAAALREAQELIGNGELEAAIKRLEPVAVETRDAAVEQLLRQTSANLAEVTRRIDAVVERIEALSEQDPPQALQLLLSQPQAIQQHSRMRVVRARLDTSSEQDRLTREAIKQAEDSLAAKDLRRGLEALESVVRAYGNSPRLSAAIADYTGRRTPIANSMVSTSIEAARQAIVAQDPTRALDSLQAAADALEFADPAIQADWNRLAQEAAKASGAKRSSTDKMQIVVKSGRPSGLVMALIAVAVVAIVGVVIWYARQSPPPAAGFLELNAAPYAEVVSITPEKGKPIALPEGDRTTPLRLDGLASGNYTVVFKSSDGSSPKATCAVPADPSSPICKPDTPPLSDSQIDDILGGAK